MDKEVPAMAVRKINENVHDLLPAISKLENDLPLPLLDNLARNFSFEDILRSAFASAIPLKPHEATRIIIIQEGLPDKAFPYIMKGLLSGTASENPGGIIRPKIKSLLEPFLKNRSSLVSSIQDKLDLILDGIANNEPIKTAASWYTPNPVMEALDQNPMMTFGYARRVPDFQKPISNTGEQLVQVQPKFNGLNANIASPLISLEAAQREAVNPSYTEGEIKQLLALASMRAGNYNAYRDPNIATKILRDPDTLSSLAILMNVLQGYKNGGIFGFKSTPKYALVGNKLIKVANESNPVFGIVLEHLINSYKDNSDLVYDYLEKDGNYLDGSGLLKISNIF